MSFIAVEPSNDYDEWTIIDINSIDVVTESVGALRLKEDSCYDHHEMDNSYIELTAVPHQSDSNDSCDRAIPTDSSTYYNPTLKSYRQALLTPSSGPSADTAIHRGGHPLRAPTANEWKPRIVVDSSIKFERRDRLYHHNLPPQCDLLDDEDDFGDKININFMTSPNCYTLILGCCNNLSHLMFTRYVLSVHRLY